MEAPLIKPVSERGGLAILGPWSNIALMDPETGEIIEQGVVTGTNQNGRANTVRFSQPGPRYGSAIIVDMSTGEPISDTVNLSNRAFGSGNSFIGESYRPDPGGPGDFSTGRLVNPGGSGGGGNPGVSFGSFNGVNYAIPNLAAFDSLNFQDVEFPTVRPKTIEGTDPVDIFSIADIAGERNKNIITQAFADARSLSRELIDESDAANQERLANINEFNAQQQREAFAELGPNAASILDQGTKNLKAFSEGRLPDALENEILNQSSRALAAQQTNITGGGGVNSTFGNRVANQLSIQQRIGLQESAINSAPSFLANALELRRGTPQRLQFDPNQEINVRSGIANNFAESQALTPGQAIQSEFQNVANELNTQITNAGIENQTRQFNAQGTFNADVTNAEADLKIQLEKLYAEQAYYNTSANVFNSVFDADRSNQRYDQNLALQQEGIDAAQSAQTIQAATGLVTTGLSLAALSSFSGGAAAGTAGAAGASGASAAASGGTGAAGGAAGFGAAALTAAGIAAGAYTGYEQITGAQAILNGERLTPQQKAALALPTFGGSLVYDDLKHEYDKIFGSGKSEDQQLRDQVRSNLEQMGGLVRANDVPDDVVIVNESLGQARKNNSHLVQLADGSYFDIGNDGNDKLENVGENIDGKTTRRYSDVDFSNDLAVQSIGFANPLSSMVAGNSKFVGHIINAATSNAKSISQVRNNIQSIANQSGINFQVGNNALVNAYDSGRIDYNTYLSYLSGWADLWRS